ncbi:two-component system nitrate/nitrite response regulator NarL [Maritalea mobilis]|uniref:Two-component system nitrate/nitrite response regulator NarL n=1 Tax=Maritalea mobilis TaxID=483324 RepID=A0A4R6VXG8_9HYPH|nr:response regulator transcription factor [Maritalea mobilis]TDQ67494.1 two-component system nitrate/nitrite response regulator NarL [Maritalea mobilis]
MSRSTPIKIILIDDHPLVLEGIRSVLETYAHIEVVGAASSAKQGLKIATASKPDVVLMDINMPEMNGIDAIEVFKEQLPHTRLLMLSMHDSREYISTSTMYGASGYLLKDVSTDEIVHAIETVAAGGTYFSTGAAQALMADKPKSDIETPLTTREQAVLLLVAEGVSNREVAEKLDISVRTVETHRKNIKKKLGISTTAGLTKYAISNGLIG